MTGSTRLRGRPHWRLRSDAGAVALVLVMALVLVLAGVVWATTSKEGATPAAARPSRSGPVATLEVIRGTAQVQRADAVKVTPARDGQQLRQGDQVRTDPAGLIEIDYADGSLTRLGPSAVFTIELLTEERGGRQNRGGLTVGESWSRAAKVTETGSFEVSSGGTTAAVEGTAFSFSCMGVGAARACTVIGVVDSVRVTTANGGIARLTPGRGVVSTNDVLGAPRTYTRAELLQNPFMVENLLLDEQAGKGNGLDDLPPDTSNGGGGATVVQQISVLTTARPPVTEVPASVTEVPPPVQSPPPAPPVVSPSDPRCTGDGWTALVGADGETFADAQTCSGFAIAGGQFAVAGDGLFVVPRHATVTATATSDQASNVLAFGVSRKTAAGTWVDAAMGTPKPAGPQPTWSSTGTLSGFETAVLVRFFLQDDTCASTRYYSDHTSTGSPSVDHSGLVDPSTIAFMDGGTSCPNQQQDRPPEPGNLDLVLALQISP